MQSKLTTRDIENQEILRGFLENPRKKFPQKKSFEIERYRTQKIIKIAFGSSENGLIKVGLLASEEIFQKSKKVVSRNSDFSKGFWLQNLKIQSSLTFLFFNIF